jgi:hypothetical protein
MHDFTDLHAVFRQVAAPGASFVAFLVLILWETWLPLLEATHERDDKPGHKWDPVVRRDRFRCQSPLCRRRDLNAHHLRFRSQGGGDELENMVSLCSWCHLYGIHEGRISATPPASKIRWTFGRTPLLVVDGRERKDPSAC